MTREEATNELLEHGWEHNGSEWHVYKKLVGNITWFASIGSVPHLPKNRPFTVNIHASGNFGENFLTTVTLKNKLQLIETEQQNKDNERV